MEERSCISFGFSFPHVVYYSSLWIVSLPALQLPDSYTLLTLCQESQSRMKAMFISLPSAQERTDAEKAAAAPLNELLRILHLATLIHISSINKQINEWRNTPGFSCFLWLCSLSRWELPAESQYLRFSFVPIIFFLKKDPLLRDVRRILINMCGLTLL